MRERIRQFLGEHLILQRGDKQLNDDDNLFESGFVNSMFALQLVTFIEEEYGVKVENEDLDINNFSSINNITEFLKNKKGLEVG